MAAALGLALGAAAVGGGVDCVFAVPEEGLPPQLAAASEAASATALN
ncbi:MAG: hypothetical protein M3024_08925 [Candidatus Dormibacteraeota bacterium]|nr:hypothetical protein [Candidatus Dormibacteraeota bacterium]